MWSRLINYSHCASVCVCLLAVQGSLGQTKSGSWDLKVHKGSGPSTVDAL